MLLLCLPIKIDITFPGWVKQLSDLAISEGIRLKFIAYLDLFVWDRLYTVLLSSSVSYWHTKFSPVAAVYECILLYILWYRGIWHIHSMPACNIVRKGMLTSKNKVWSHTYLLCQNYICTTNYVWTLCLIQFYCYSRICHIVFFWARIFFFSRQLHFFWHLKNSWNFENTTIMFILTSKGVWWENWDKSSYSNKKGQCYGGAETGKVQILFLKIAWSIWKITV